MAHEHARHKRFWLLGALFIFSRGGHTYIHPEQENQEFWLRLTYGGGDERWSMCLFTRHVCSSLIRRRFLLFTGLIMTFLTPHDRLETRALIDHVLSLCTGKLSGRSLCTDFFASILLLHSKSYRAASNEFSTSRERSLQLRFTVCRKPHTHRGCAEVIERIWAVLSLSWQCIALIDSSGKYIWTIWRLLIQTRRAGIQICTAVFATPVFTRCL